MTKEEEIRMINEKLDFYVMEASDEEFDTEEVRKLVKRLDELDPIPLPWKSDEEALKDFWEYCEERQREERIMLLYTGSSFSLWKVTKIIFLFHQNYFSRKKFCGYRFRLHVLLLKLSTVSINSLLRRVEFIDFCGWFLHASFLSDHFFRVIHMKK